MAKLLQTLILIAFVLLAAHTVRSQPPAFTLSFRDGRPADVTLQGDADFPAGVEYLRLTPGSPNKVGRVLYSKPIEFWNAAGQIGFETDIRFLITPRNDIIGDTDGLAFFIAPVGSTIPEGSGGGNLGIFGSNGTSPAVFAVEYDTKAEGAWDPPPTILGRLNPHVGIDLGSRQSNRTGEILDVWLVGQPVILSIHYDASTKTIDVIAGTGFFKTVLSYKYDLSSLLTQQVQVGISAATGLGSTTHDIETWRFTSTGIP